MGLRIENATNSYYSSAAQRNSYSSNVECIWEQNVASVPQRQAEPAPQDNVIVVKPADIKNKPHKYMKIENGKVVLTDRADLGDRPAYPYVKNGTVKVEYIDGVKTFTYKNGRLLQYQFNRTKDEKGLYPLYSKGDYQTIEFYPNGNIKSVDTRFLDYGDFGYTRFTCNYDSTGKFISGKEKSSSFDNWEAINAENAKGLLDNFVEIR